MHVLHVNVFICVVSAIIKCLHGRAAAGGHLCGGCGGVAADGAPVGSFDALLLISAVRTQLRNLLCVHNFDIICAGQMSGHQRFPPAPLALVVFLVCWLPELAPPQAAFVFVCLIQSLWPLGARALSC